MDKSNFNLQNSLEANYLNITLSEDALLDEIAIKVIKNDCPDFLLPFHVVNRNDRFSLKYKLMNTIALAYSNLTLKKDEFLKLYMALLTPFIKGADWFLDYHYICIDPVYVYLSRELSNVSYLYIPETSYRNSDDEVLGFFKSVLDNVTVTDDGRFLVQLYQYFHKGQVTLTDLSAMLQKESMTEQYVQKMMRSPAPPQREAAVMQGTAPVRIPPKPQTKPAPATVQRENLHEHVDQPTALEKSDVNGEEDEVMQLIFGENPKKKKKEKPVKEKKEKEKKGFGLFGKKKETKTQDMGPENFGYADEGMGYGQAETVITAAPMLQFDTDVTEIMAGDSAEGTNGALELVESPLPGAPRRISLDFSKDYITIGRESADAIKPDIQFGREFRWIGRMHARIEKSEGMFYIIDLGSANHTLLDGQRLIPNHPYLLRAGAEVGFTSSQPVRYRVVL